jgi:hypothetical protein
MLSAITVLPKERLLSGRGDTSPKTAAQQQRNPDAERIVKELDAVARNAIGPAKS